MGEGEILLVLIAAVSIFVLFALGILDVRPKKVNGYCSSCNASAAGRGASFWQKLDFLKGDGSRATFESIDDCLQYPDATRFVAVGYRKDNYETESLRKTCFGYMQVVSSWEPESDDKHYSMCTDSTKRWPNCNRGDTQAGWLRGAQITDIEGEGRFVSLQDCKAHTILQKLSHVAIGFNKMDLKCFAYDKCDIGQANVTGCGATAVESGNASLTLTDTETYESSCVNDDKTWPNCS